MTDYIKREDAREKLCSMCRWEGTDNCGECEHPIDDITAADVASVRHGKWIKCKMSAWGYRQWYECSKCGEPCFPSYGHPARTNFCHNCGAKMDGGQDDA